MGGEASGMDIGVVSQIVITTIAVIVTYYAAIRGAERGARLSELATIDREVRERSEEQKRQKQQVKAIRLLIALEIRQNLIDLDWLLKFMVDSLGEEVGSYYQRGAGDYNPERYRWLEARQRFVSLYIPDWAHKCWDGQQSSYLVPVALGQLELRQVSRHHSQLDRLTKIKNMLAERAARSDPNSGGGENSAVSSPFEKDAPHLWNEFVAVSADILRLGNPLSGDLQESGVEPLPALPAGRQAPELQPSSIEDGHTVTRAGDAAGRARR